MRNLCKPLSIHWNRNLVSQRPFPLVLAGEKTPKMKQNVYKSYIQLLGFYTTGGIVINTVNWSYLCAGYSFTYVPKLARHRRDGNHSRKQWNASRRIYWRRNLCTHRRNGLWRNSLAQKLTREHKFQWSLPHAWLTIHLKIHGFSKKLHWLKFVESMHI